ncbi:hypothetical protein T09_1213 [Trichinella sp. T9]|nr:hypothetical protein T09_1213 [Trichinella sp. T9]
MKRDYRFIIKISNHQNLYQKKTILLMFVNTCVKQTVHIVNAAVKKMFSIQFPKEILAYSLLTTFLFAINELQGLKLANIQAFQVFIEKHLNAKMASAMSCFHEHNFDGVL